MIASSPSRWKIIVAFGLVYVFWGSTYLGIGIAVEQIPPAFMCAARFLIAGIAHARILRDHRTPAFFFRATVLSFRGGRNAAIDGRQPDAFLRRADRSHRISALLVAISPLWFLVIDSLLLGDHHISNRGKIGLAVGLAGVIVLIWPDLIHPTSLGHRELWWSIALQGGSMCWALGSVLSKKWQTGAVDPFSSTAWQVFFAGLGNLAFAFAVERNSNIVWTVRGVSAILYLVVCGSWIGYTAYIWLLQHVPTSKVSTYAYVNPVVAVFLGWLVLHERIDRYILMGSAIIVASVVMVTSAKIHARVAEEDLPAVEPAGD